ncbi:hypothetical protein F8M49_10465 [Rhodococcus zopfii]|uniref:Transposase n=1 Tax=Rhodococcus zopfii TaxID=43772 RepID=A0ABU3WNX5_9NOCA|nr:hypothetical protein [Rhodococcus zopfii]
MKKDSQKPSVADAGLVTPDRVSVAMAEVAEDMQAGLLVVLRERGLDGTLPGPRGGSTGRRHCVRR